MQAQVILSNYCKTRKRYEKMVLFENIQILCLKSAEKPLKFMLNLTAWTQSINNYISLLNRFMTGSFHSIAWHPNGIISNLDIQYYILCLQCHASNSCTPCFKYLKTHGLEDLKKAIGGVGLFFSFTLVSFKQMYWTK